MKIKLGELLTKKEALEALVDTAISGLPSFRVAKAVQAVNDQLTTFEKTKNDLINKYSNKKDENGNAIIEMNTPEMEKYNAEVVPLLNEEVNLDIQLVKVKDLKDVQIKPKFMAALIDFVIEG